MLIPEAKKFELNKNRIRDIDVVYNGVLIRMLLEL